MTVTIEKVNDGAGRRLLVVGMGLTPRAPPQQFGLELSGAAAVRFYGTTATPRGEWENFPSRTSQLRITTRSGNRLKENVRTPPYPSPPRNPQKQAVRAQIGEGELPQVAGTLQKAGKQKCSLVEHGAVRVPRVTSTSGQERGTARGAPLSQWLSVE